MPSSGTGGTRSVYAGGLLCNLIEQVVEASYPRKKIKGNISKNSQSDFTRVLLGYNQRTQHLQFTEDNKGWGHTKLKSKYKTFQDLFKAYPSGRGIINGTKLNPKVGGWVTSTILTTLS